MYKSLISLGLIIYDADMDESFGCIGRINEKSYAHFAGEILPSILRATGALFVRKSGRA